MSSRPAYYYATQIVVLSFPFLIVPFLARTVGPVGLGAYGIGQGIALIVSCIVEYGFMLSGARWLAQYSEDPVQSKIIVSQVLGAKFILTACSALLSVVILLTISSTATDSPSLILAVVLGLLLGHNPYWYFGGIGRTLFLGSVDLVTKAASVVAIFMIVRSPGDVWKVFMAQAAAQFTGLCFSFLSSRPLREGIGTADFRGGLQLLRRNVDIFFQNIMGNFYTGATSLMLSFALSPVLIGYFAGAERLTRAAMLPMVPLRQTFFPSTVVLVASDLRKAKARVRLIVLITATINFSGFLVLFFGSDIIVRIALGSQFAASVPILRALAPIPLFSAATDVLSTLWLLPHHRDRYCTIVVALTTVIHVCAVFGFSKVWGPLGSGYAVLTSSFFCLACMIRGCIKFRPGLFK